MKAVVSSLDNYRGNTLRSLTWFFPKSIIGPLLRGANLSSSSFHEDGWTWKFTVLVHGGCESAGLHPSCSSMRGNQCMFRMKDGSITSCREGGLLIGLRWFWSNILLRKREWQDSSFMPLPPWSQWWCKPCICLFFVTVPVGAMALLVYTCVSHSLPKVTPYLKEKCLFPFCSRTQFSWFLSGDNNIVLTHAGNLVVIISHLLQVQWSQFCQLDSFPPLHPKVFMSLPCVTWTDAVVL